MSSNQDQKSSQTQGETSAQSQWTVGQVLNWMTDKFKQIERQTPRLDAQLLLSHVTKLSRVSLYTRLDQPLSLEERAVLRELVKRRVQGEPVAYILEEKEWHDMQLFVDKRVLIPRPETETLFDVTLAWCKHVQAIQLNPENKPTLFVDLCTGSGCLALAFSRAFPTSKVIGVDVSEDALAVAQINQDKVEADGAQWIHADVTSSSFWNELDSITQGHHVVFISNPPYVSEAEWNQCDIEVNAHEPKLALVADDDGLSIATQMIELWHGFSEKRKAEGLGVAIAIEVGEDHPQKLFKGSSFFSSEVTLMEFHPQSAVREFPYNEAFVCSDYEGRNRFFMTSTGFEFSVEKQTGEETVLEDMVEELVVAEEEQSVDLDSVDQSAIEASLEEQDAKLPVIDTSEE